MIKIMCEQRSEAWYQARIARVTGTAFSDLMAKKDTAAYTNLVNNIACEIITESIEDSDVFINEDMQRGIDTEPIAKKVYANIMGVELEDVGFVIPDEENEFHEWVGISPDALIIGGGMLEIKCPRRSTHISYIEGGCLPSKYVKQVQGQLFVTKLSYCDFMSFCEGMKPFIIRVLPDEKMHHEFENELRLLIKSVKEKVAKYNNYSHE